MTNLNDQCPDIFNFQRICVVCSNKIGKFILVEILSRNWTQLLNNFSILTRLWSQIGIFFTILANKTFLISISNFHHQIEKNPTDHPHGRLCASADFSLDKWSRIKIETDKFSLICFCSFLEDFFFLNPFKSTNLKSIRNDSLVYAARTSVKTIEREIDFESPRNLLVTQKSYSGNLLVTPHGRQSNHKSPKSIIPRSYGFVGSESKGEIWKTNRFRIFKKLISFHIQNY